MRLWAVYPRRMGETSYSREFPAELARAGEARHFVSWLGAVAGLRGGALSDLAVAAEAALTDIFLSGAEGALEIESETREGFIEITVRHPGLHERRMAGLGGVMEQFLDGYRLSPKETVLIKRLG